MTSNFIIIIITFLGSAISVFSQEYFSKVFFDDSLSQSSKEILIIDEQIYVLSGRRCLPDFRQCSSLIKMDLDGDIIWEILLPDLDAGNDNVMLRDGYEIIITGLNNEISQISGFYFYKISIDGEILEFNTVPLQNIVNYNLTSAIDKLNFKLY